MRVRTECRAFEAYRALSAIWSSTFVRYCLFQIAMHIYTCTGTPVLQSHSVDALMPRAPVRRTYLLRIGQSLNLTCPYEAPFYSWTHSDQSILADQQRFTIRSTNVDHSGHYICQAVDGYGTNSVDFTVRVIDPTSYTAQRECALDSNGMVIADGPCFLKSYSDRDLNLNREWGDDVTFDCDSVVNNAVVESVHYTWDLIPTRPMSSSGISPTDSTNQKHRLLARASASQTSGHSSMSEIHPSRSANTNLDLGRYNEPKLKLDQLTLRHNGEYRCVVTTKLRRSTGLTRSETISRTFRLVVKPRTDGQVILGPRSTNQTVTAGEDVILKCEINPDEHRSSTIRWGKSISPTQRVAYESSGREVIQWAGGTFVVLPSLPTEELAAKLSPREIIKKPPNGAVNNAVIPGSDALATEASRNQVSQLFLRQVKPSDAGRYVCSVLTEAGRDDHKFVRLIVTGSTNGDLEDLVGGGTRRLTVYIAVPIAVFFVCLCVVTYCLVSRRASRRSHPGHRRQRNFYVASQSQMKSASAASSSSIGVCRNGLGTVGSPWNASTDPRMRPSPAGTGQNTATLAYSSTNGSNSIAGTGPIVMPTQGYSNAVSGTVGLVPTSYPMLLQSVASQPANAFYAVPDPNALTGFQQNPFTVNAAGTNEYMLTSTPMNVYRPGTLYPISNGHAPLQGGTNVITLPGVNSSPDSSAVAGPGSPMSSDNMDGRVMFQLNQLGQQPLYTGYPNTVAVSSGANFRCKSPSEYDPNQPTATMLSYHAHTDNAHA